MPDDEPDRITFGDRCLFFVLDFALTIACTIVQFNNVISRRHDRAP